jgi:hypothetical protein
MQCLGKLGFCPPRKTLDRYPDRDGHYEPGNCRWATDEEQANNNGIIFGSQRLVGLRPLHSGAVKLVLMRTPFGLESVVMVGHLKML